MKKYSFIFCVGGLVLALCDRLHVYYKVLGHPKEDFSNQFWWVFLLFGVASVVMVAGYGWWQKIWKACEKRASLWSLGLSVIFCIGAYLLSSPLQHYKITLSLIFGLTWLFRIPFDRNREEIFFCLLLACVGPLVEAGISATGNFQYFHPDFLGVPLWLPGIYLHGGFLVSDMRGVFWQPSSEVIIQPQRH